MDQPLADVDSDEPYVIVGKYATQRVEFLNPKPEQIRLIDIAWGLARSCRFQTHMNCWYSTAEHCVLGSLQMGSPELARQFLIHDAAEYVFSDLSAPIKVLPQLAGYKELESNFEKHIFRKYLKYDMLDAEVKVVDKRMCATEAIFLRNRPRHTQTTEPYLDVKFKTWDWQDAYLYFHNNLRLAFPNAE